ncbi:hypothetical protein EFA69_06475 [Rufibacter immobilis]|uniref:Uncharacterized protein n=1 Tax=Rufibacter immobilis TaxID=1348778 RepID=A0A3M9MZE6_9BACT|nr:hypothetical protein [Rufibacter immobilis]RNI30932.1 hypothetical protein EFA69_06475 [Rufibacter immobilis]
MNNNIFEIRIGGEQPLSGFTSEYYTQVFLPRIKKVYRHNSEIEVLTTNIITKEGQPMFPPPQEPKTLTINGRNLMYLERENKVIITPSKLPKDMIGEVFFSFSGSGLLTGIEVKVKRESFLFKYNQATN